MQKIKNLIGKIITFLICFPIFTFIKVLKMLNIYKIYISTSELHRIGSVLDFEFNHTVCQKLKKKRKFIYLYSNFVANSFVLKRLKLHNYTIIKVPIFWLNNFEYMRKILGKFFFEKRNFDFKVNRLNKLNKNFYLFRKKNKLLFKLEKAEIDFCEKILKKNKIDPNKKFVSFHIRDDLFLKEKFPNENWDHHLYRDYDKKNFFDAANYLASKQYNIFVLGNLQYPFQLKHASIFDYANSNFKNDIMDFYLSTKCEFFLATMSGIDMIPFTQNIPMIYLMIDFPFAKNRENILVSTKHFVDKNKKKLSINDLITKQIVFNVKKKNFDLHKIRPMDPDKNEILELIKLFELVIIKRGKLSIQMLKLEEDYFSLLRNSLVSFFKKNKIKYSFQDLSFKYRFNINLLL